MQTHADMKRPDLEAVHLTTHMSASLSRLMIVLATCLCAWSTNARAYEPGELAKQALISNAEATFHERLQKAEELLNSNDPELSPDDIVGRPLLRELLLSLRFAPERAHSVEVRPIFLKLAKRSGKTLEDYVYGLMVSEPPEFQLIWEKANPDVGFVKFYRTNPPAAKQAAAAACLALDGAQTRLLTLGDSDEMVESGVVQSALLYLYQRAHGNVWEHVAHYWPKVNTFENLPDGRIVVDLEAHKDFAKLLHMAWRHYCDAPSASSPDAIKDGAKTVSVVAFNTTRVTLSEPIRKELGVGAEEWARFRGYVLNLQKARK